MLTESEKERLAEELIEKYEFLIDKINEDDSFTDRLMRIISLGGYKEEKLLNAYKSYISRFRNKEENLQNDNNAKLKLIGKRLYIKESGAMAEVNGKELYQITKNEYLDARKIIDEEYRHNLDSGFNKIKNNMGYLQNNAKKVLIGAVMTGAFCFVPIAIDYHNYDMHEKLDLQKQRSGITETFENCAYIKTSEDIVDTESKEITDIEA